MSVAKTITMMGLLLTATVSSAQIQKSPYGGRKTGVSAPASAAEQWEEIKSDTGRYLCGEGLGETIEEADEHALADLISKISICIESDFSSVESETVTDGDVESQSLVLSKVKTFSSATLTNTERIVISNEPEARIGRYILRSELDKIFAERTVKVKNYVEYGQTSLENKKIDDALRYYYWSLMMLQSIPHSAAVKTVLQTGEEVVLSTWLPLQLDLILDSIRAKFVRKEGSDAVLSITYKDEPVSSLDYTYFDGRDWSNIYSAKDGVGIIELPSDIEIPKVQLRYETTYRSQAHIDPDVMAALKSQKLKTMKKAYCDVVLTAEKVTKAEEKQMMKAEEERREENAGKMEYLTEVDSYSALMSDVCKAIKSRDYASVQDKFTPEGYDMFTRLVGYGKAVILDDSHIRYYKFRDRTVARDVQMSFRFSKGSRQSFVEDIVFTIDADNRIECLAFGLADEAFRDIASNSVWTDLTKMSVVEFLENYKTAYSLKRLDYLQSIFDDNAVIIIGHVAYKKPVSGDSNELNYNDNKVVTRTRVSKEKYMQSLASCFASNEFVNIRFTSNEVRKYNTGGETYGIQIKQDYYSTNYGDTGYLFLMVDLNNPDLPVIKVRTWQENSVPMNELITTSDF